MTPPTEERRTNTLTDGDLSRIAETFDERVTTLFETIGYDVSTPEARHEINEDHGFVRALRNAKGTIIGAFFVSVGTGIAVWLGVHLFNA